VGNSVPRADIKSIQHTTSPPARYTEPTLVKRLEEEGIGRPSTYASILGTIINRGYVWKKGQALVPSWTAFAVVRLLKDHFTTLVDYKFTATVEEELDEIAEGKRVRDEWLAEFYYGNGKELPGLKPLVMHNIENIDAASLNAFPVGAHPMTGEEIVLRPGKYGPYVRCGEQTAAVPETLTPDELTVDDILRQTDGDAVFDDAKALKQARARVHTAHCRVRAAWREWVLAALAGQHVVPDTTRSQLTLLLNLVENLNQRDRGDVADDD
jgi:hypothetical protein